VGATHARLALFAEGRREPVETEIYRSAEHRGLIEIVKGFLAERSGHPAAATVGVAGPVRDGRTEAVNLAWPVDARELAEALKLPRAAVAVINDLEANAWGLSELSDDDLVTVNTGEPVKDGTLALISAGTGLGEAFITFGSGGREVHASEGGHADFAPRSELESELREWVARDDAHVSYENVCSGIGLRNIYEFLRSRASDPEPEWLTKERHENEGRAITQAGLERRDAVAGEALDIMVSIYGAQAGNLALTVLATGGVYLGGGIAPRVLPRLQEGEFMRAFGDKGRLSDVVQRIPVYVILNELTALLGAGRYAAGRLT
jgi:glucokinase